MEILATLRKQLKRHASGGLYHTQSNASGSSRRVGEIRQEEEEDQQSGDSNRPFHSRLQNGLTRIQNGFTDFDERTALLGGVTSNSDGKPLSEDDRAWVRWPAYTAYISYRTLTSNYVNVLLVFVPLGIIAGALGWNPTAVFLLNFFAIIPLASLLSFATEELSVKLGQTLGGLLNATFGNAVELIVRFRLSSTRFN